MPAKGGFSARRIHGRRAPGPPIAVDMQPDHIATAFGRVLREQREARGISQEDLALSADVDRSFVSQMERGIRQPTLTTLVKLCKALGVAPSTIIGRMERLLD